MKINYIKRILCSLMLLVCIGNLSAQKESNWWYFGHKAGLNFNKLQDVTSSTTGEVITNIPEAITGPIHTNEGCFTLSNPKGKLMMSGDGASIWNRNNTVMPNATNLGGSSSSSQSGIIIPIPGSRTQYYAMSVGLERRGDGIQYAIVDMSLNGGLGGIVSKNIPLLPGITDENIAAVKKANSQDWWLIHIMQNSTNGVTVYVWDATASGITLSYTQTYNFAVGFVGGYIGILKFSTDGTRFVRTNFMGTSLIFGEFDPATGTILNIDAMNGWPTNTYGVEFSLSGDLVYIACGYLNLGNPTSYQIPWTSLKAKSTTEREALPINVSNFQMASDGRIYAIVNNTRHLAVILEPENIGSACNMHTITNYLQNIAWLGLPTFASSWFIATDEKPFVCRGNNFRYTIEISFSGSAADYPVRLEWDWGDGSPIETQNTVVGQTVYKKSHNYTTLGEYTVTITPYSSGMALERITLPANVIDCKLQVNRNIRINLPNTEEQNINL